MSKREISLIEWPDDISKVGSQKKKRFETADDVKRYVEYHTSEESEDNKKFLEIYSKDKEECNKLLYSKGYVIPYELLNEEDLIGEENPYNSMYESRKIHLRERSRRRRRIHDELQRWHVRLSKNELKMHHRIILNVHEIEGEDREHTISVILRWLCRSVGVQEVYMYNALRGRIGYRYYSNESVVVIYIEEREGEMDRKQLYRIRRILRKEVVKRCRWNCSLHDKWIVVIDTTGQVTCSGYGVCDMSDVFTGKDIIHKIKHFDPMEEYYKEIDS